MKKILQTLFIALTYSLLLGNSFATTQDLEWQRIELERLLDTHYTSALATILERGTYQVKTNITYNDPGMPNFDDLNKDGFKISEVEFDDSKGDYIAFSKVGLEVPVVKKFYKENQKKLKELYRYQDAYNLFKNIESVNLSVTFSDELLEGTIEAAKKVIQSNRQDIAGIDTQVKYNVEKIKYTPPPKTAEELEKEKNPEDEVKLNDRDYIQLLGRFGNAIGLILTTLLIGTMVYFLLKRYLKLLKEIEDEKNKEDEEPENIEDENIDEDGDDLEEGLEPTDEELIAAGDINHLIDEREFSNFEKVAAFMDSNPNQFALMVKRWINENGGNSNIVLTGIIQQLDPSRLQKIQSMVTPIERSQWLSNVDQNLSPEELQTANKLIIDEIVREMVSDKGINDYELLNILIGLDSQTAISFITNHPKEGGILLNLLSPSFTSKILQQMDERDLSDAISNGLNENVPTNQENINNFKALIIDFKKKQELKPFNFKIAQILPQLNSEKEQLIYDFMGRSKQIESIMASAHRSLPSELILRLPSHILKFLLQNYPLENRIQLLISLPESESEDLLDTMATQGSSAREMIEMEVDTIKNDEMASARIKKYGETIWQQFVNYTRETLSTMPEYKNDIEELIKHWALSKAQ